MTLPVGPLPLLEVGQEFNPHWSKCGFFPAEVVDRQPDVEDLEKLLYHRLVGWAGQRGSCYYGYITMAKALGRGEKTIRRTIDKLVERGLIKKTRFGRRVSNEYRFLFHPWFVNGQQVTSESSIELIKEESSSSGGTRGDINSGRRTTTPPSVDPPEGPSLSGDVLNAEAAAAQEDAERRRRTEAKSRPG